MAEPTHPETPPPGTPTHPETPPPGTPTQGLPGTPTQLPADQEVPEVQRIRHASQYLIDAIRELGPSREASIAVTNIETGTMWAVRAHYANQPTVNPTS